MRAEIEHKRKKPGLGKSNRKERKKKRNRETVKKTGGKGKDTYM